MTAFGPVDSVIRHGWLFADQWVQESADEIEDEDFDYRKRDERIDRLRREAMTEIWTERGFEGVEELLTSSGAAGTIGRYAVSCVTALSRGSISSGAAFPSMETSGARPSGACRASFWRLMTLAGCAAAEGLPAEERSAVICHARRSRHPRGVFWTSYGEDIRAGYWKDVFPSWGPGTRPPSSPN